MHTYTHTRGRTFLINEHYKNKDTYTNTHTHTHHSYFILAYVDSLLSLSSLSAL